MPVRSSVSSTCPWSLFGSLLFDRRGAYGVAILASAGFGLVTFAADGSAFGNRRTDPIEIQLAIWGLHTGALLLVGLLSSTLAGELRIADQSLRDSRSRLTRLEFLHQRTVDSLTSGLMTTDTDGRVMSCNPEGERILGVAASEIVGKALGTVVEGFSSILAEGSVEARTRERVTRKRDGGRLQYLGVARSALRSESGAPEGHVVIFQDVTQVVELEDQLARNARLAGVGELSASIAHEIRNPLAAISGSVEMLEGEAPAEERHRLRAIVLREIARLDRLIGDFLVYARPSEARFEAVGLEALLAEIVESAKTAGTRVRAECASGLFVEADRDQLQQVLWNLLRNADQAMAGEGSAVLAARSLADASQGAPKAGRSSSGEGLQFVEISVSDTGTGIAPEALERIFDPFFTTKPEGTGLGLPTVHRILEAHRATIQVESRVGCGTTMRLLFPRIDPPRESAGERA